MTIDLPHIGLAQQLRPDLDGHGVRTTRAVAKGEVVVAIHAVRTFDAPHRMTIQLDGERHIELAPTLLERINHGCDPNVAFDVDRMELVALRDIAVGAELTAFYPATEWQMASPFVCACGADDCLGVIRGSAELPAEVLQRYRLSAYVRGRALSS